MKFLLLIMALALPGASVAQSTFAKYVNARYAFSVEYPSDLLIPQEEAHIGDGRLHVSKDGAVVLTASARPLGPDWGRCDAVASTNSATPGSTITYQWKKDNTSIASGKYPDGRVFYQKALRGKDKCMTVLLEYPEERRSTMDPLVSRIAGSLRDLGGR